MTDDNLLAFAEWCRINPRATVLDLETLRRVFTAYDQHEGWGAPVEVTTGRGVSAEEARALDALTDWAHKGDE